MVSASFDINKVDNIHKKLFYISILRFDSIDSFIIIPFICTYRFFGDYF